MAIPSSKQPAEGMLIFDNNDNPTKRLEEEIMSTLNLHNQISQDAITVSGIFIDEYMPYASGEFVKLYLYLLRAFQKRIAFSVSSMADSFDLTEKDVIRALLYWERKGLLRLDFDSHHNLTDISLLNISEYDKVASASPEVVSASRNVTIHEHSLVSAPETKPVAAPRQALPAPGTTVPAAEKEPALSAVSPTDIDSLTDDDSFRELLFVSQTYLKRTFKSSDCDMLAYWYLLFNHSYEVIEYLVEYCVEQGRPNMSYMDAVARSWHEQGFRSVSEIKDYAESHTKTVYSIMKAFGLSDRSPAPKESEYIKKWSCHYAFSLDLILKACEKTISAIHSPSFEYTDSILSAWKKSNIDSLDQVAALDQEFQSRSKKRITETGRAAKPVTAQFHNFKQRSTDYDQLVANYYGYNN